MRKPQPDHRQEEVTPEVIMVAKVDQVVVQAAVVEKVVQEVDPAAVPVVDQEVVVEKADQAVAVRLLVKSFI